MKTRPVVIQYPELIEVGALKELPKGTRVAQFVGKDYAGSLILAHEWAAREEKALNERPAVNARITLGSYYRQLHAKKSILVAYTVEKVSDTRNAKQ